MQNLSRPKSNSIIVTLVILLIIGLVGLILYVSTLTLPVAFSASPTLPRVILLLECTWFGDAKVVAGTSDSTKEQKLFDIMFSDCNEKISKFTWSQNGEMAAWLIADSNRYPTGKRLIIFSFRNFPNVPAKQIFESVNEDIVDFEFGDASVIYRLKDGTVKKSPTP